MRRLLLAALMVLLPLPGLSKDSVADSDWWRTPAIMRCCSIGDAVYADDWRPNADGTITARVTGGGPRDHSWAPIGREYVVPSEKIVKEPGNPTGRPLLFLQPWNVDHVYCFALGPMG